MYDLDLIKTFPHKALYIKVGSEKEVVRVREYFDLPYDSWGYLRSKGFPYLVGLVFEQDRWNDKWYEVVTKKDDYLLKNEVKIVDFEDVINELSEPLKLIKKEIYEN